MDIERLELLIERSKMQQIEHTGYILGNYHDKPAWWYIRVGATTRQRRGIKAILLLIEEVYPDFYQWLLHQVGE